MLLFLLHFGCVEQLNLRRQEKVPVSVSDSCACSSQQPHPPAAVCSTLCDSIQPVPLSLTLDVAADDHSRSLSPPSLSLPHSLHNKVHAPAWCVCGAARGDRGRQLRGKLPVQTENTG